jgi:hypothetical protein
MSHVASDQRRHAALAALGWTLVFWIPASIAVALAVGGGHPGANIVTTVARFIVDESGESSCFVIAAVASAAGYPLAAQRWPNLRPGFFESQCFGATIFGAMLAVAIPLHVILEHAMALQLTLGAAAAIFIPLKLGVATAAAMVVYPWWSTGHERRVAGRQHQSPGEL